ncbi:molybdopterin molybdotransferase MoeA [Streptomyces sp. LP05-1]|uniref:Molybdopterin molybdenumtransferase n=1 Tax=Streptomyces pyxinae TaxID=2970734 RepID=A0ABT2CCW8_9ACTN|nr:molybdopterin molybdotransferase MoeA [Streptomyces sp. LP05-1]MCS0635261.1 molybdopterin molybdotransferase MoeA [Streptomyces sp. LP05-1]
MTGQDPAPGPYGPDSTDGFDEALALLGPPPHARSGGARAGTGGHSGPAGHQAHRSEDPVGAAPGDEDDRARYTPTRAGAAAGDHPAPPATPAGRSGEHRATAWEAARATAERAGHRARAARPPRTLRLPLTEALGHTLAEPLTALTDLPPFDTSAMDGWAVAGPGPWTIHEDTAVLAGHAAREALPDGEAVRIATGARVPPDATAVIRGEHARADAAGRLYARRPVVHGQDIRPRGQECRTGDRLLPATAEVTPAVLGLAAAAGYDELTVAARPRVAVLVLGDELLTEGLPHDGLVRDALGPMLAPWLRALGAEVTAVRRVTDDADALRAAITGAEAELVLTTGGTAAGPVDHLHSVLDRAGAEPLVDGVKARPGHPMLLARLAPDRHLVGLPGNPLAAVSGLLTLAAPLLRALTGRPAPEPYWLPVREELPGHPYDVRLVPVVRRSGWAEPLRFRGPAMLRGVAAADGLAVVPIDGARAGEPLEILALPWSGPTEGCFT